MNTIKKVLSLIRDNRKKTAKYRSDISLLLNKKLKIRKLFDNITTEAAKRGRKIKIIYDQFTGTDGDFPDTIEIHLNKEKYKDCLDKVFVHELGEADYIAKGFPFIKTRNCCDNYGGRLTELFSHPYIPKLLKKYGLGRYEKRYCSEKIEKLIHIDFKKEHSKDWQIVLYVSWSLITFPTLRKKDLVNYSEFSYYVDKIVEICLTTSPAKIETNMMIVLDIFKELGLLDSDFTIIKITGDR